MLNTTKGLKIMGKFELNIATDNAAFDNASGGADEVARLLREAADKVESGGLSGQERPLRDINGNTVGAFFYADENGTNWIG